MQIVWYKKNSGKKGLTMVGESDILSELSPGASLERGFGKKFCEKRKKGLTNSGSCGKIAKLSSEGPCGIRYEKRF